MATITAQLIDETYDKSTSAYKLTEEYRISGATSSYEAEQAGGLPKVGQHYLSTYLQVTNVSVSRWEIQGNFKATVNYEYSVPQPAGGASGEIEEGDEYWSFSFGTEQAHITNAESQKAYGSAVRTQNNLINPDEKGIPQGVDILAPRIQLQVTRYFAGNSVTGSLLRSIVNEVAKVNDSFYYGLRAGELIFLGVDISNKNENSELVPLTFQFGIQENLDSDDLKDKYYDVSTGSYIEITDGKQGWQHIGTDAIANVDDTTKKTKFGCVGVYVNTVYKTSDFSGLGLSGEL